MSDRATLLRTPAFIGSAYQHRELILLLARREVLARYRGSILGIAWSFIYPLLMLAVYTFVFSVVFKARWGAGGDDSKAGFAIMLFVGLIVHGFFAECVNRAPLLIVSNANYVKKVIFPLEILPWVAISGALFHTAINVIVLVAAQLVFQHTIQWTIIFLPILFVPLVLGTIGLTWLISALGVYVRDMAQTIGILTTVLLFLSPVFYPLSALPEQYHTLLLLNPLTFVIEEARSVLIGGKLPDLLGIAISTVGSSLLAWLGYWWFHKTRVGFADVI